MITSDSKNILMVLVLSLFCVSAPASILANDPRVFQDHPAPEMHQMQGDDANAISFIIQLPEGLNSLGDLKETVSKLLGSDDEELRARGLNLLLLGQIQGLKLGLNALSDLNGQTLPFLEQIGRIGQQTEELSRRLPKLEKSAGQTRLLAVALSEQVPEGLKRELGQIQTDLLNLGGRIGRNEVTAKETREKLQELAERVAALEAIVPNNLREVLGALAERTTLNSGAMRASANVIVALRERVASVETRLAAMDIIVWVVDLPKIVVLRIVHGLMSPPEADEGAAPAYEVAPSVRDGALGGAVGATILQGMLMLVPRVRSVTSPLFKKIRKACIYLFMGCTLWRLGGRLIGGPDYYSNASGRVLDITESCLHRLGVRDELRANILVFFGSIASFDIFTFFEGGREYLSAWILSQLRSLMEKGYGVLRLLPRPRLFTGQEAAGGLDAPGATRSGLAVAIEFP